MYHILLNNTVFHVCHRICQTQMELSQQCSGVVHVSDWLLKYVNSSDEYSRVCEELNFIQF